ncbi:oxaloacetate decarboxylase, mitochondrial-like isoform X2 [Branchiostoma lanceolatum]|uniref:Oxaloacetate tautomerase FAHD1, mitochondrial n=1 Tax=Branchiostoma lanceolatum TaxID=7740 RepID=A0A8J9ZNQ7_BRALA|nr:FAHD1 [Branchiostoma lanceolatum]
MTAPLKLSRFYEWGRKIVGVGRNYRAHCAELGNPVPKEPVLFLKPTTAYLPEGKGPTRGPPGCTELHHEIELGVVISGGGTNIPEESAMDHVGGYVLALDMTARDYQNIAKQKGIPWTWAKCFDTACPISEFVPKEKVHDPQDLDMWLKVNGEVRQKTNTNDMIFTVPYIISYISKIMTLERGDLILTGTPMGVSGVQPNDQLEAEIEGVVAMKFTVGDKL